MSVVVCGEYSSSVNICCEQAGQDSESRCQKRAGRDSFVILLGKRRSAVCWFCMRSHLGAVAGSTGRQQLGPSQSAGSFGPTISKRLAGIQAVQGSHASGRAGLTKGVAFSGFGQAPAGPGCTFVTWLVWRGDFSFLTNRAIRPISILHSPFFSPYAWMHCPVSSSPRILLCSLKSPSESSQSAFA